MKLKLNEDLSSIVIATSLTCWKNEEIVQRCDNYNHRICIVLYVLLLRIYSNSKLFVVCSWNGHIIPYCCLLTSPDRVPLANSVIILCKQKLFLLQPNSRSINWATCSRGFAVLSWCTGSRGNNHCHWLKSLVSCFSIVWSYVGSCEPVHEDRTGFACRKFHKRSFRKLILGDFVCETNNSTSAGLMKPTLQ